MSDERKPKEASKLFYDMIKASVSPKATGAAKKKEVKPKTKKWTNSTMKKNKSYALILCLIVAVIALFLMVYDHKYAIAGILFLLILPAFLNKKFRTDVLGF